VVTAEIIQGDCLEVMPKLEAESFDSVVTDPPYGLSFMGKDWDHGVPGEHFWREVLRVAKPGAHLLAFGGTRTFHRLACAIGDAGWEIRDCLMWVYGMGFPKSLDVSKAIDKAAGAERPREKCGTLGSVRSFADDVWTQKNGGRRIVDNPITSDAARWQGWGTALKPAWEPIILARKPLSGTVAENVMEYGTGAINVDGCRVFCEPWKAHRASGLARDEFFTRGPATVIDKAPHIAGRFPANLIHDGSEDATEPMGEASRFFYCAKASKSDRDDGNNHPTVKPTDLMRYLCRLVTPPGGTVLDPFAGSGSTGKAAILEGFEFIGIEVGAEYCALARARIAKAREEIEAAERQAVLI
jgi:site-specific DNA-methyltransferase (adenine-specific)